jgi:hypothetical protein
MRSRGHRVRKGIRVGKARELRLIAISLYQPDNRPVRDMTNQKIAWLRTTRGHTLPSRAARERTILAQTVHHNAAIRRYLSDEGDGLSTLH